MKYIRMVILFLIPVLLAVTWRIYLYRINPQELVYDQRQYYIYANYMLLNGIWADSYRTYGYPLIVLPLVYLFGSSSQWPWLILHSCMEIGTAMLVYGIGKMIFRKHPFAPYVGFILYLANPYTGVYAGVLLSEISTCFFLTLLLFLYIYFHKTQKKWLIYVISLLAGFFPQLRPGFIFFCIAIIIATFWNLARFTKGFQRTITKFLISLVLFTLPFGYTVLGNFRYFREFSPFPVENPFYRELYISMFVGRGLPFFDNPDWHWPPQAYEAWYEYSTPTTRTERQSMQQKYLGKSLSVIRTDFPRVMRLHLAKLWYIWEKHMLYTYSLGPDSPFIRMTVYWGNVLFVLSAFYGVFRFTVLRYRQKNKNEVHAGLLVIGLFLYISFAQNISTTEERFSLPAYPMVALFSGLTLTWIGMWAKRYINRLGDSKG